MKQRRERKKSRALVKSHLGNIQRALLEGEKRPAFLEFLKENGERRGLYALYDSRGRLYYTGKASDLSVRLNQHLKDKHADSWERMTLFFLSESADVAELEGLLIATAKPKGNKQKPRIGKDLRSTLRSFLKEDALGQIDGAIYPEKKQIQDKISKRITPKKLKTLGQEEIADALNISQGRVSQLINNDRKGYSQLLQYIKQGSHRDKIILLLEKHR
mgnify:CR=1 FL=1